MRAVVQIFLLFALLAFSGKLLAFEDYYAELGISPDATTDEVNRAYRLLSLKYHPDVGGDTPENIRNFKAISSAFEVLHDADERARYDRSYRNYHNRYRSSRTGRASQERPSPPRQDARSQSQAAPQNGCQTVFVEITILGQTIRMPVDLPPGVDIRDVKFELR